MSLLSQESWSYLLDEVAKIASSEGIDLWDVEYKQELEKMVLRIYIDKPGRVNIDDCASINRQVGAMLEVEDMIKDKFNLEVSSPGMDRKLVKPEHYETYLGRKVKVQLKADVAGRKKYQGVLESFDVDKFVIDDLKENQKHSINLRNVLVTRLVIEL